MSALSRRVLLGGAGAAIGLRRARAATKLRLSYQLSSALLLLLRQRHTLEDRLAPLGFTPDWVRWSADAMRTGAVDLHSDVAEPVPLFMHPANPALTLYAAEGPSSHASVLVVRDDSPIRSVADLRGHTIGSSRGSTSHCLLLRALAASGLTIADVHPAFLEAADASAAFAAGSLDAWAIYDPFYALTEAKTRLRVLIDGAALGMRYDRYYMANADFAAAHPEAMQVVFTALQDTAAWIRNNRDAADAALAQLWGNVPLDTVQRVNSRRVYDLRPIGPVDIANLHALSETFLHAGILHTPADVAGIPTWTPKPV